MYKIVKILWLMSRQEKNQYCLGLEYKKIHWSFPQFRSNVQEKTGVDNNHALLTLPFQRSANLATRWLAHPPTVTFPHPLLCVLQDSQSGYSTLQAKFFESFTSISPEQRFVWQDVRPCQASSNQNLHTTVRNLETSSQPKSLLE